MGSVHSKIKRRALSTEFSAESNTPLGARDHHMTSGDGASERGPPPPTALVVSVESECSTFREIGTNSLSTIPPQLIVNSNGAACRANGESVWGTRRRPGFTSSFY